VSGGLVFIAGWGRSGSTLLDRLLGRVDGVMPAGELREVWERGLVENRLCGCGEQFSNCPFWRKVGEAAFGGWDQVDVARVRELRTTVDRPWTALALLLPRPLWPRRAEVEEFLGLLRQLYSGVAAAANADVVVDSSKIPTYCLLLRAAGLRPRVLHLVRDARGVVFSWRKTIVRPDAVGAAPGDLMLRYGTGGACARYVIYNFLAHLLRPLGLPYLRLRYEDVAARPAAGMSAAADFLGKQLDPELMQQLHRAEVVLEVDHTVDGNPMRFEVGPVAIRPDGRWRTDLAPGTRRAVTAMTAPLLSRYGYLRAKGSR
jgi:hypothetical protein